MEVASFIGTHPIGHIKVLLNVTALVENEFSPTIAMVSFEQCPPSFFPIQPPVLLDGLGRQVVDQVNGMDCRHAANDNDRDELVQGESQVCVVMDFPLFVCLLA